MNGCRKGLLFILCIFELRIILNDQKTPICMKIIAIIPFFLFILISPRLPAQVLDWDAVRTQVLAMHPAARQADLLPQQAASVLLRAKGGFDPRFFGDYAEKRFNGKQYFQFSETGVKWPVRAGMELKGSFNYARGNFLNPENSLPTNGQAAFGLEWSLGQGLLYDERRAALDDARVTAEFNKALRASSLNDLLFDAAKAYWSWFYAANSVEITQNALEQVKIRHVSLVESFLQGDKPAVDTLETFIQLQNRQLDLQFARMEARTSALELVNFLWTSPSAPLDTALLPVPPADNMLSAQLPDLNNFSAATHPDLMQYAAKRRALEIERKLKNEKRKPVLNVNYALLGNQWTFFPTAGLEGPSVVANDMKWGVNIYYPLLNRKARGDYDLTKIKISQTDLNIQQKIREITTKTGQYITEANTLLAQVNTFRQITENYRTLLDAEIEKFAQGESSVFLINTREQRWLDARLKYLKLVAEWKKAEAGAKWAAGQL